MITGATQLGDDRLLLTVDHDPQTTATDAFSGSIIVFVPSGRMFIKQDDGSTTNVVPAIPVTFQFGETAIVPAGGTLQLNGPGQSLAGARMNRAGLITGASIQVNVADGARAYNLEIRVNGVAAATLALALGTTGNSTTALSVAVVAGDFITAFMVRTAGAGGSTFTETQGVVEVSY